MGTYTERMICNDDIGDLFHCVLDKLQDRTNLDLDIEHEDSSLSLCRPNELPKFPVYNELCALFKEHCEELFKPTKVIYEDEKLLAVATLYMAMGAPIAEAFRNECIDVALGYDVSEWKFGERRRAFLDSFIDALCTYDGRTPLFEVNATEWETPTKLIALPWVTLDQLLAK